MSRIRRVISTWYKNEEEEEEEDDHRVWAKYGSKRCEMTEE